MTGRGVLWVRKRSVPEAFGPGNVMSAGVFGSTTSRNGLEINRNERDISKYEQAISGN